jgi:GWxTD domain-containing protein
MSDSAPKFLSKPGSHHETGAADLPEHPDPGRDGFIEAFWQKRDPVPATEVNEFKDEYYGRIGQANRLFADGGPNGWLEDRGRIHILLGPPWERRTYPRGVTFYGKPTEIWYYGSFPIVFTDSDWNGTYELDPTARARSPHQLRPRWTSSPRPGPKRSSISTPVAGTADGGSSSPSASPPGTSGSSRRGAPWTTLELPWKSLTRRGRWPGSSARTARSDHERCGSVIGTDLVLEIPARPAGPRRYALRVEIGNRLTASGSGDLDFEL